MSLVYEQLSLFVRTKMRMSHIYQPAMLIALLKNGGRAPVHTIARALLAYDTSQIEYYEHTTKNMVGRVLTRHKMVSRDDRDYILLDYQALAPSEKDLLIGHCEAKIAEFIEKRGKRIWAHRKKSGRLLSGTLRYEVFKNAKFRCLLCGASASDKALEVDHIIPHNAGGSNDISNLQALCYSCNATKRDRDDTDFRRVADSYHDRESGCVFCDISTTRKLSENALAYAIRDRYPVTPGHTLVIPKRHVSDYFELYQPERNALHALLMEQKTLVTRSDPMVTGFNIGNNFGKDAGQTIFHCHFHLIPRRSGDVSDPRGGVRGVIPDNQRY